MFFRATILFVSLLSLFFFESCKSDTKAIATSKNKIQNSIRYAKGFELYHYSNFSILKITRPWPNAQKTNEFVLHKKGIQLPDSLVNHTAVIIPIKKIVATSTTHIPSLEMLHVENTLVGFPNTDYISSVKTRNRIDTGFVKNVGANEALNIELLIDLQPDVIIGFGIDSTNPSLDLLQKTGQQIIFNGDWVEQSPLGKAEWIKLFGVLYNKDIEAEKIFESIEKEYLATLKQIKHTTTKPTVLSGAIYQGNWYLPQGDSWSALFIADAHGDYLWKKTIGTGSLSLSFETVFEKAQAADFWIGPAQFSSLSEMENSNPHYSQFKAFQNKKVYSYSVKKGAKGGLLYYELAPNRPDIVLKDLVKILHPELLPHHELFFFNQLQ